jgi:hypothetical protein
MECCPPEILLVSPSADGTTPTAPGSVHFNRLPLQGSTAREHTDHQLDIDALSHRKKE